MPSYILVMHQYGDLADILIHKWIATAITVLANTDN